MESMKARMHVKQWFFTTGTMSSPYVQGNGDRFRFVDPGEKERLPSPLQ
ncbi:hypothetical protein [Aminivibrio sp.]